MAGCKGINLEEKNGMWKGDDVGYKGLHEWVRKHKPKPSRCPNPNNNKDCLGTEYIELANISGKYKRDEKDYEYICASCHRKKDMKKTCKRGHPRNEVNIWTDKHGYQHCRECRKITQKKKRKKINVQSREWVKNNREKYLAIRKRHREKKKRLEKDNENS